MRSLLSKGIVLRGDKKLKTIFDLRKKQEDEIYQSIEKLYGESLNIVKLGDNSIKACIGCWNCWLKTPGICVMKDQMSEAYTHYINSDTVILLMDTAQGFINNQAKAFFDRTIPHYHHYIEIVNQECHHVARYQAYPDMVFYYDTHGLTKEEEQVIEDYLYRTAFHFKSKAYRIFTDEGIQLRLLESRKPKRKNAPFASVESMEKLVIYNGSPRISGSNSTLILDKVVESLGNKVEVRDLKERDKWEEWAGKFQNEKHVMFFMPLYVHAMPSHVMKFIEKLNKSQGSISFFIQSGFPESSQSHFLEAYFEQLALRLGRTYLGTVIKGGIEGLQGRQPKAQERTIGLMKNAIAGLVSEGKFMTKHVDQLAIPIRFNWVITTVFKLLRKMGVVNSFWDKQLKENQAFEKSFDRPYLNNL